MAAALSDWILDNGLNAFSASTHMVICDAEPTDLSLCSVGAANALGYKDFGAGNAVSGPAAGSPNGRAVTSTTVTDGTIVTGGTAHWWAIIDGSTRRHAHGALYASQVVSSGNTFNLGTTVIRIPAEA
jgi:hypothetical protein